MIGSGMPISQSNAPFPKPMVASVVSLQMKLVPVPLVPTRAGSFVDFVQATARVLHGKERQTFRGETS